VGFILDLSKAILNKAEICALPNNRSIAVAISSQPVGVPHT